MFKKVVLLSLFLCAMACDTNDGGETVDESAGLHLNQTLKVNDTERDYHLYLPKDPKDKPVVVLLHGNGGNFDQSLGLKHTRSPQKIWLDLAKENDFILLVPNGNLGPTGRRGWNDCRNDDTGHPDSDDVAFIEKLLQNTKTHYDYNDDKTFIAGVSNGGLLAQRLAQEIPDKITAFAAVIAEMPENSECDLADQPISALFMNGTDDPIMPYEGGNVSGNGGTVKSTEETVHYWVARNGTSETPEKTDLPNSDESDDSTVEKWFYKNGDNNTEVVLYKIIGGGHTEPSKMQRYRNVYLNIVGPQNGDIEMASAIWSFFKDKMK